MLFRASPPIMSEDDSYEQAQRRSRRRAKRRPRKFWRYSRYHPNFTSVRFLVVSALLCLLIYELFLLRSSPSSGSKTGRFSSFSPPQPQPQQHHSPQQPVEIDTRSVLNARARAVEEAAAARDREALRRQGEAQAAAEAAAAVAAAAVAKKKEMDERRLPPPPPRDGENFWDWYQKSRRGGKIRCEEPNKRLCEMTYKMVHKYKVRTLYDLSCGRTASWMHIVLRKVSREIWGFRYICANPNTYATSKLKRLGFVTFSRDRWWRDGFPPEIDLVFAWDVLAHTAYGRVWSFFVNVKRANVKYVLVDNYPGILNDPSPERFYLNLRKHPFRFPAAKEVVQNVTEPGETANRQLLFYDASTLPDNLG